MSEKIKLSGSDNPVDMFLIEAMVAVDDRLESFMPNLRSGENEVEVVLTINGNPAPFAAVAQGFFDRAQASIERDLLERARSLVTAAGLYGISNALQDAEWKIEAALAEALDKQAAP